MQTHKIHGQFSVAPCLSFVSPLKIHGHLIRIPPGEAGQLASQGHPFCSPTQPLFLRKKNIFIPLIIWPSTPFASPLHFPPGLMCSTIASTHIFSMCNKYLKKYSLGLGSFSDTGHYQTSEHLNTTIKIVVENCKITGRQPHVLVWT